MPLISLSHYTNYVLHLGTCSASTLSNFDDLLSHSHFTVGRNLYFPVTWDLFRCSNAGNQTLCMRYILHVF